MKVPDAEALYAQVKQGMPVWVVYEPILVEKRQEQIIATVYPDVYHKAAQNPESLITQLKKMYPQLSLEKSPESFLPLLKPVVPAVTPVALPAITKTVILGKWQNPAS
jgi:hypothetical protein